MAFALHFLKILANDPGERNKSFKKATRNLLSLIAS